jgi:hypothetical protein
MEQATVADQDEEFVDAPSEPEDDHPLRVYTHEEAEFDPAKPQLPHRSSTKSFVTASSIPNAAGDEESDEHPVDTPRAEDQGQPQTSGLQPAADDEEAGPKSLGKQPLSTVTSHGAPASTMGGAPSVDADSTSSLLRKADLNKATASADAEVAASPPTKGILDRVKRRSIVGLSKSEPPRETTPVTEDITRRRSNLRNLVKFDIPEDSKRQAVHFKAKKAQMTIQRAGTKLRRKNIKDGVVVKMERMLVRVDAADEVPEDFDENVNQRVVSRVKDKWREYMIVCRHSHTDDSDFLLQLYQTRVSLYVPYVFSFVLTTAGNS